MKWLLNLIFLLSHVLVLSGIIFTVKFSEPLFLIFSVAGLYKLYLWQIFAKERLSEGGKNG